MEWVGRLLTAADRIGCVSALALADIKQTWSADEEADSSSFDDYDEEDDEDDHDGEDSASYDLGDLFENEISLGWWKRAGAGQGGAIALGVDESEVCAVTATDSFEPYESEYEGYMGNYGNTLDRWYRRAALVIWPIERDFIARAEADAPGAISELHTRLAAGQDLDLARQDARELVELIGSAETAHLDQLLTIADALDDAGLAHALLGRLPGEGLTPPRARPPSRRFLSAMERLGREGWWRHGSGRAGITMGAGSGRPRPCRRSPPRWCGSVLTRSAPCCAAGCGRTWVPPSLWR